MQAVDSPENLEKELSAADSEQIKLEGGRIVFTLPGLHRHLFPNNECTFIEFRQALYKGSLNASLGARGYSINIEQSTGKANTSRYYLALWTIL